MSSRVYFLSLHSFAFLFIFFFCRYNQNGRFCLELWWLYVLFMQVQSKQQVFLRTMGTICTFFPDTIQTAGFPLNYGGYMSFFCRYNPNSRFSLEQQRQRLPVYGVRKHVLYMLETFQTLVLVGETGSGKSTQVPQVIYSR